MGLKDHTAEKFKTGQQVLRAKQKGLLIVRSLPGPILDTREATSNKTENICQLLCLFLYKAYLFLEEKQIAK